MYIPKQGDIIYLTLNPQAGHEQSGRRPVLVISRDFFNEKTTMAIICPITNTDRNIPSHVRLGNTCTTTGVVMCEQVKSLDLCVRDPEYKDRVNSDVLFDVIDIVKGFLEF